MREKERVVLLNFHQPNQPVEIKAEIYLSNFGGKKGATKRCESGSQEFLANFSGNYGGKYADYFVQGGKVCMKHVIPIYT